MNASPDTPVSVGLIGCGIISRKHARGYLAQPEAVRVVAVADVIESLATERAEQLGGADRYTDYSELLRRNDLDAVDICLPHHLHADAIVAAAEAGKHILCEKPLCLTPTEAARIKRAVADNGVQLMCAHNALYLPAVARAKELIADGALGRVYELRTTDSFANDFDPASMGWRARRETSGGGELIDTGYHPTYLLLYLAGATPLEVTAMLSKHRLTFMDGEDSARVLVRFDDGMVGEVVTSWAYNAPPFAEKFSVCGELGSLWSDATTLYHRTGQGEPVVTRFPAVDTTAAEIADFVACVREGRRPIHTESEGTDVLEVILAAYRSVDLGRVVALSELEAQPVNSSFATAGLADAHSSRSQVGSSFATAGLADAHSSRSQVGSSFATAGPAAAHSSHPQVAAS
jgi:predicted dehydrogenase